MIRHESTAYWHQPPLFSRYEGTHTAASLQAERLRRCRSVDASFFPVHQPVGARRSLIFLSLLSNKEDTDRLSPAASQRADTEAHRTQVYGQVTHTTDSTGHHNNRDFSRNDQLSSSDQGVTSILPDRTFSPGTAQSDEDLKTVTTPAKQSDFEDSSMLSSTVVTVMAPHFGRRTKRFDGPVGFNTHMQDVTNTQTNLSKDFQRGMGRTFSNASQEQLGARVSTVDWSTKSGPASLNYRLQSIPTRVSSEGPGHRNEPEVRSPSTMRPSDVDQKNTSQTAEQRGLSSLGSKPTTSSLLLSLRRLNSNNRPPVSEPPTQSSAPRAQEEKLFKTHLSHRTLHNNLSQERFSPTPSSSSGRTSDTAPSSSNTKTAWFSSSTDEATDESSQRLTQSQSRFLASRQAFMEGRPYSSLQERGDLGKEISKSSARDSANERSVFIKSPPPKRTTLSESSAGWKQPPLIINDTNTQKKHGLASVSSNNIHNMSSVIDSKRPTNDVKNNGHNSKTTYPFNLSTVKKTPQEVTSEKLQNLPDLLVSSKITSTQAQSMSRLKNDPFKNDALAFPHTFRKPSLTLDLSSTFAPGQHRAQSTSSFQSSPVSPLRNSPSPSFPASHKTSISPIGFERSYASIPKPFQSDAGSKISYTVDIMSKRNFAPLHGNSTFTSKSPTPSALTPPPANTLHLLTPPSTPVPTSPSYSEILSPQEGRTFPNGVQKNTLQPEKAEHTKEKKKRRVTWEDSVGDSKPISEERLETSTVTPQSPTTRSIHAPSIFSFLRTNSPTTKSPPACIPTPRTSSIHLEKKDKYRSFSSDSADGPSRNNRLRFSDNVDSGPARQDLLRPEADIVPARSSAALSLPPDFLSGYKVRYSSPPYSTLVSTRSIQGEGKRPTPRSPLFKQQSQPSYTGQHRYVLSHHAEDVSAPKSELRQSTACLPPKVAPYSDGLNNTGPLLLVDNRLQASPKGIPSSSSTCVTETLVYSIKADNSKNTKPDLLLDTFTTPAASPANRQQETDLGSQNQRTGVTGKNGFLSTDDNKEQQPKKSRFILKKYTSTPSSNLSRSDSDRSNKTNSKMTVLSKLKQTFSTRRSEDDPSFPWKFRRSSQTPSLGGLSDHSTSSESAESNKTPHKGKDCVSKDKENGRERNDEWIQKRYSKPLKNTNENHQFSLSLDSGVKGQQSEGRSKASWTKNLSTSHQSEETPNPCQPSKVASPKISPGHSQLATSPCSRSPFSPFPSLSPLSPHSPQDAMEDNVFYSPKLRRRKDSLSSREPREGISLGGSTRTRLSTGPPSSSSGNSDGLPSSYADLKYGIEPGRSVSVSSVLSCRPSGPGRISTGSRVMSVGDLTAPSLSCRRSSRDLDQWAFYPDSTTGFSESGLTYPNVDASQMRSRSLPRSLTRRLADWGSELSGEPAPLTTSKSAGLWSPSLNICQFTWDAEGPPTPPPTPPLSPVTRRMSKPSSVSSSNSTSSSGDSQETPRGRLPSKGYISSLSSFQESSESSSDTTTDDEYYLDTDDEKESEL